MSAATNTIFDEVLQGAIRESEIKGLNFAVLREPRKNDSCSPQDHLDIASYTSSTHCNKCGIALYEKQGLGLVKLKTRADVDQLLADLEETLKQDLSIERRSSLLATKAAYLGSIGLGKQMLETAQQAYDLLQTRESAKALSDALFVNGRPEEIEPLMLQVVSDPTAAWIDHLEYATSLRYLGRVHEAAEVERKYHCAPARHLVYWDGGPCDKLHFFLHDGFGDCLYNLRFLERIKARGVKEVVVCVQPHYGEDFAALLRAQPWIPKVVVISEDFSKLRKQITCALSSGDAECILDLALEETPAPPLWTVNHQHKKKYEHLCKDKPLIGLCWAARQMKSPWVPGGALRSLTNAQVEKIVREVKDVQFVSLQFKQDPPIPEILSPKVESWRDTAGLIANLDAVVCVDTAVMHLSEGMRKPTFVLSSGAIDHRLVFGQVFYPNAKVFRNKGFWVRWRD